MPSVPRTALPGCSQSANDRMAKGLGYLSLALGTAELLAAKVISRTIGLNGYSGLVRAYGVREIATGVAILASHDATPWIWGRVAGDAADLATVAAGAKQISNPKTLVSLGILAGATAMDVLCARRLVAEKGGPKTSRSDYSDRSGFPKGVLAAKAASRGFQPPHDMRAPDQLQPWGIQREDAETQRHPSSDSAAAATATRSA